MADSLEKYIETKSKYHQMSVNETINVFREFALMKNTCIEILSAKNLDLNTQNVNNCLEKMKSAKGMLDTISKKIY